jgi:hypothetical protein
MPSREKLKGLKGSMAYPACNLYRRFVIAMRNTVADQVSELKKGAAGKARCGICQNLLQRRSTEADHVVPFRDLLERFCGPKPWDWLKDVRYQPFPGRPGWLLISREAHPALVHEWKRYHRKHARLELLCRECHSKKDRVPSEQKTS